MKHFLIHRSLLLSVYHDNLGRACNKIKIKREFWVRIWFYFVYFFDFGTTKSGFPSNFSIVLNFLIKSEIYNFLRFEKKFEQPVEHENMNFHKKWQKLGKKGRNSAFIRENSIEIWVKKKNIANFLGLKTTKIWVKLRKKIRIKYMGN